jgi:hypothetical protein
MHGIWRAWGTHDIAEDAANPTLYQGNDQTELMNSLTWLKLVIAREPLDRRKPGDWQQGRNLQNHYMMPHRFFLPMRGNQNHMEAYNYTSWKRDS